ncbi:MAG: type II secretion system F family protein [Planctomycetota bacterium]|jgi:tight adherence protein C|nr:type II secretion system F family protein [Planctomycetota bacterium]
MGLAEMFIVIAFGVSVGLVVWILYSIGTEISIGGNERELSGKWIQVMLLLTEPFSEVFERMRGKYSSEWIESLLLYFQKKLRIGGLGDEMRASEFILLVPAAGVIGFGMGLFAFVMAPYAVIVVLFTIAGISLPFLWLRDRVIRRQNEIGETLPFAMDLLTLMTEAGLDFTLAMERISRQLTRNNALGDEFYLTQREISMGRNRSEAMRNLALRTDMFEVSAICAAIIQADELGASFGPTLRVQADQIRTIRAQQIEKKAMEAPVKILFPLIVFIFPTTFVVIFGPVFLSYML